MPGSTGAAAATTAALCPNELVAKVPELRERRHISYVVRRVQKKGGRPQPQDLAFALAEHSQDVQEEVLRSSSQVSTQMKTKKSAVLCTSRASLVPACAHPCPHEARSQ